jgi:hypothetical protein
VMGYKFPIVIRRGTRGVLSSIILGAMVGNGGMVRLTWSGLVQILVGPTVV